VKFDVEGSLKMCFVRQNFIEMIFRLMKVTGAYTGQRALATWYPVQCDPGRGRKAWRDQKAGVTYQYL